MKSGEATVRALFESVGLTMSRDEFEAAVDSFPMIRQQADALAAFDTSPDLNRMLAPDEDLSRVEVSQADDQPAMAADGLSSAIPVAAPHASRHGAAEQTIQASAEAIRNGTISAVDLTTDVFENIERFDVALGAFVARFYDKALRAAEVADRELRSGHDRGPLHGIPLAIKDIIATNEAPTRANSLVPPPRLLGDRDATVVARLRRAGAIIVGKASTSEFALGHHDPTRGFPLPRNAWDPRRFAGSSSSGTAVAVAAGLALGGLGSDTSGSIRHPSALNGVTGLKVSSGRVPLTGVIPLAPSNDTVGPMARSAWDCALLLQVIAGHDPNDPSSSRQPVPSYLNELTGSVSGLRIGVPWAYFFDASHVSDPVKAAVIVAINVLKDAGARIVEVNLPNADMAKMAAQVVVLSEGFAYHRDRLINRWSDYGVPIRGLLAKGAFFTAADYVRAKEVSSAFRDEFLAAASGFDVLITPTMPGVAIFLSELDPTMNDRYASASFLTQWNLIGVPGCAVPVGFDQAGMPISMQVVGKWMDEATVLRVADAYQRLTDVHLASPPRPPAVSETAPEVHHGRS